MGEGGSGWARVVVVSGREWWWVREGGGGWARVVVGGQEWWSDRQVIRQAGGQTGR